MERDGQQRGTESVIAIKQGGRVGRWTNHYEELLQPKNPR